jgi:hypothetical protein
MRRSRRRRRATRRPRNDRDTADHGRNTRPTERKAERTEPGEREGEPAPNPALLRHWRMLRELELLAEVPPGAEDERLHGRDGQAELRSDLRIRLALNLPEEDDGTLVLRQAPDGRGDFAGGRTIQVGDRDGDLGVESDLLRAPGEISVAPSADIARDRDEPGPRLFRLFAAANRPERVQESNLGDILCFVRIAHVTEHGSVDIAPVLAIEPLERRVPSKSLLKGGAHAPYMPTEGTNITSPPCKFRASPGL